MKLKNVKRRTLVSLIFSMALIIFVLASGVILPEANTFDTGSRLSAPSLQHPFGTDQFGRDVLLRTIHGFRYTFLLSLLVQIISFPVGVILGVILGYYGGVADEVFYQFSNLFLSFPLIILAILIASLTGASIWYLMLLIVIYGIITNAKIVRG